MRTFNSFFLVALLIAVTTIGFTKFDDSDLEKGSSPVYGKPEILNENSMKPADIISIRERTIEFKDYTLLDYTGDKITDKKIDESLNKYVIMTLNKVQLQSLLSVRDENITLDIPVSKTSSIQLKLFRVNLYSDDFSMYSLSNQSRTFQQINKGIFYRGIINDDEKSIACISVYSDHVTGFYSNHTGNYEFGRLASDPEKYIFYNTSDDKNKNVFECGLGENEDKVVKSINKRMSDGNSAFPRPMKIYFQTDYSLWLAIGQNPQAINNYVTAIINYVATMYQNDNLPLELARVEFWQSADPYTGGGPFEMIKEFAAFMQDQYNLDIYNLLTTRYGDNNAIAGGIRVLCNQYDPTDSSGRYTCSSIALNVIPPYPQYSNVALAVGHEMGHIIGSRHTHACVWPVFSGGGIGSIDTCVITGENSPCYQSGTQPNPKLNGTLMSYCDLGGGSVNASLGFGPLPGDTCRLRYNQAPCLSVGIQNISTVIPENFMLYQNYPNPFNPVTHIKFDIESSSQVKLEVYDIRGRLVEVIYQGYLLAGKYSVDWQADMYSSGVYYYRLSTDKISLMNKMVLLK